MLNANAGLPQSLGQCRLVLGNGDFLDFRQPSSLLYLNGNATVGSFTYTPTNYLKADLWIRPIGDVIGRGVCTVRHELEKIGQYELEGAQVHLVKDRGTMTPCSNVWGQKFTPEVGVDTNAALICKAPPLERFGKTIYI